MNLQAPTKASVDGVSYTLPYPPSANGLYANRKTRKPGQKGRVKTDKYLSWQDAAGKEILAQGKRCLPGTVIVFVEARPPDKRPRDIDNLGKACLDLLVWMGVIEDDKSKHVRQLVMTWGHGAPGVTVSIWSTNSVRPPEDDFQTIGAAANRVVEKIKGA